MTTRALYPVIHVDTREHALVNAAIAATAGADGIFLIDMEGRDDRLVPFAAAIRKRFPDLWMGVNALHLAAPDAARLAGQHPDLFSGVWVDHAGLHSTHPDALIIAALQDAVLSNQRFRRDFRCFAAAAFKGQRPEPHPEIAARMAQEMGWTPTTSGSATGSAPPKEKLARIRGLLGTDPAHRLAVASGFSPENVTELGVDVDDVLCATGLFDRRAGHDEFDPAKVRAMVAALAALPPREAPRG